MSLKVQIKVSNKVVIKSHGKGEMPVAALITMLSEKYGASVSVERQTPVSLTFVCTDKGVDENLLGKAIFSFMAETFEATNEDVTISFETVADSENEDAPVAKKEEPKEEPKEVPEEAVPEKTETPDTEGEAPLDFDSLLKELFDDTDLLDTETDTPDEPKEEPAKETPAKKEKSAPTLSPALTKALDEIDALVGCDGFKSLAKELVTIAPQIKANKTFDSFTYQNYVFSINDGYGLTTCLDLFRTLIAQLEIRNVSMRRAVIEEKVMQKTGNENPFAGVYSILKSGDRNNIQVVCIDISEWLNKTDTTEFSEFLHNLLRFNDMFIYIFRVPFVDKEVLSRLQNSLNDIVSVKTVTFPPLTSEEIRLCAERELKKYGFRISRNAWKIFDQRITEEKSDGRFYGLNTIHKVVREILYKKQLSNARKNKDDKLIGKQDLADLCMMREDDGLSGWDMLDALVGADGVRNRIKEIVTQIELARKNTKLRQPCIHMRFVGNPGTGKTTVARIVGKILREMGVLRLGNFYEYGGRDFVGRYIGETAPKTAGICRDAYGSVLFIDEAYSLFKGEDDTKDFGREALDTLIAEMENHRTDFVVIMAGYTDDMERLMRGNAGLASRVPYIVEFPNFTKEELYNIFVSMAEKDFAHDDEILPAAKEYFLSLPDEVLASKEFSNARFVRNLYERVWAKAAMRVQLEKGSEIVLTKDDFDRSVVDKEFTFMMQKKPKNRIGFGQ